MCILVYMDIFIYKYMLKSILINIVYLFWCLMLAHHNALIRSSGHTSISITNIINTIIHISTMFKIVLFLVSE